MPVVKIFSSIFWLILLRCHVQIWAILKPITIDNVCSHDWRDRSTQCPKVNPTIALVHCIEITSAGSVIRFAVKISLIAFDCCSGANASPHNFLLILSVNGANALDIHINAVLSAYHNRLLSWIIFHFASLSICPFEAIFWCVPSGLISCKVCSMDLFWSALLSVVLARWKTPHSTTKSTAVNSGANLRDHKSVPSAILEYSIYFAILAA